MASFTGSTRVYGVIGQPVRHSRSPAMQNAALRALGEDAVYAAFPVAPERLQAAVLGLAALGVAGVNVTIPHKERVVEWLTQLTPEAERIGAVNTIAFRGEKRIGHNTDGDGFLAALHATWGEVPVREAVILGAGGAARAVAIALAGQETRVSLANRTKARGEALATLIRRQTGAEAARSLPLNRKSLAAALDSADLLVNATAVGMAPGGREMPPVPLDRLRPGLLVCDLIYNPRETRLLREARERGCRVVDGVPMLAHQGALALEWWLGRPAPASLMEETVRQSLAVQEDGQA